MTDERNGGALGGPLISDAALRGMYRTVEHLSRTRRTAGFAAHLPKPQRAALLAQPEALHAALLSQLHRRDTVLVAGNIDLLQLAAAEWFPHGNGPVLHAFRGNATQAAALGAGMALRNADWVRPAVTAQAHGDAPEPVTIVLLSQFPTDMALMSLVHERSLALVLVVVAEAETRGESQQRQVATPVPLLPVDRDDAVALCRVLQECLLRARSGWGGTIVHALAAPGGAAPAKLLGQHLRKRGLPTS